MYLKRYGFTTSNKNRVQIFTFPKVEMRDIRIERADQRAFGDGEEEVSLYSLSVDVQLRYIDEVSMQNVTMIRGFGFTFRNVDMFNLSAFNVIQSVGGIQVYCSQ